MTGTFLSIAFPLSGGGDPDNEADQDALQDDLGAKVAELRSYMAENAPSESSCAELTQSILDFVGESELRATVPSYRRDKDYLRAREYWRKSSISSRVI